MLCSFIQCERSLDVHIHKQHKPRMFHASVCDLRAHVLTQRFIPQAGVPDHLDLRVEAVDIDVHDDATVVWVVFVQSCRVQRCKLRFRFWQTEAKKRHRTALFTYLLQAFIICCFFPAKTMLQSERKQEAA